MFRSAGYFDIWNLKLSKNCPSYDQKHFREAKPSTAYSWHSFISILQLKPVGIKLYRVKLHTYKDIIPHLNVQPHVQILWPKKLYF